MEDGNDCPDVLMDLMDELHDVDTDELSEYLASLQWEDSDFDPSESSASSRSAPTTTAGDSTTPRAPSPADSSAAEAWHEGSILTNSPYFNCSLEKKNKTASKCMVCINWTKDVLTVVPQGGTFFNLLSAEWRTRPKEEGAHHKTRALRRRITIPAGPGNRSGDNRQECTRFAANFTHFLDRFFNRDAAALISDLMKYDRVIRNAIERERKANEDKVKRGLKPKRNNTLSFDIMVAIFEAETDEETTSASPSDDQKLSGRPADDEGSNDADMDYLLRNVKEMKKDISNLKNAVFPGAGAQKRPRPAGDLAAHESVKPGALKNMHRGWCDPGRVVGQYRKGIGALRLRRVPLHYKVISTRPSDLEAPQVGVKLAHQVRTVTVGECPIKLHDDEEYAKLKEMGPIVAYVYVHDLTEVRVTKNPKHHSIVAQISRDQDYADTDIFGSDIDSCDGEERKPIIRVGFPHFQDVEGVRATVDARYITAPAEGPVQSKKVSSVSSVWGKWARALSKI